MDKTMIFVEYWPNDDEKEEPLIVITMPDGAVYNHDHETSLGKEIAELVTNWKDNG